MADIFISYSKSDEAEARVLAAFLEAEGYSVSGGTPTWLVATGIVRL